METCGVVLGATRHILDVGFGHADREQLRSNGAAQVDVNLVLSAPDDDSLRSTRRGDLGADIAPDLEAAGADARPNGCVEWAPPERFDRGRHYLCHHPAPAGVHRRHVAGARVCQKERNAVGHSHSHRHGCGFRRGSASSDRSRRGSRNDRVRLGSDSGGRLDDAPAVDLLHLHDGVRGQVSRNVRVGRSACRERVGEALVGEQLGREEHGDRMMPRGKSWYHSAIAPMRSQDPFIGRDILNGSFQILQKVGSGGMGAVYRALQREMNRMVGVKILHPKLASRSDLVLRFRREARAMSQLTHPNTVKVFLYGELDDGSLYIIMEFLEGKNLNQTLRADGPFSTERALPILIQVCGALDEAHKAGIIHRDLKPENIFIVQSAGLRDFPKVLDFGLAKMGERQMRPGSVILTQEGMVFGTPEFMSPEQAQGKPLTPGSDIYSLAVILYEVLTGKLPFDAKTAMDYIQLHVTGKPIPLNQRVAGKAFPPLLEQVMDRALSKRPEDRFSSAADFASAMQQVLKGDTRLSPMLMLSAAAADGRPLAGPPVATGPHGPRSRTPGVVIQPTPLLGPLETRQKSPNPGAPRPQRASLVMLLGIALGFLLIGVGLAVALMRFVIR